MSYNTERPAGREHILPYPKGFIVARIIQLVLGIICLGLTAYIASLVPISGAVLMLFTSIVCLISSVYILVAHFNSPVAYNYWAILGLDAFHALFWLISFALLASQAALILSYSSGYYGVTVYGAVAAAGAGLGAVNWVIYVATLVLHSLALHRHRTAGLHAMPGKPASAPVTSAPPPASAPTPVTVELPTQPQKSEQIYEAA
ncbi:hypothetical protein F5Y12DRAFT_715288 [Xylaria sp. FL1777]|nr:hypothetical protein F5Y12DRAFT_715288 [Xylaria sp. FL1777]